MRRFAAILFILFITIVPVFAEEIIYAPEGWVYVGYPEADIVFAVPESYASIELTTDHTSKGYVEIGGNDDFTLQMKAYVPEQINYDDFLQRMTSERPVQLQEREVDGTKVAWYARDDASATSELIGIIITGSDGWMYRLSIFAGANGDFSPESNAYEIGMTMAETVRLWAIDR